MAKRIREVFFILLLLTFPLGEIVRVQFSNNAAVAATDIAVFLFVLASLFRKKIIKPRLTKPLLIFVSVATVSLLINLTNLKPDETLISTLYLLRWVAYAGVYLSVVNLDNSFKNKVPVLLAVVGAVMLAGGIAQYFLYPNLRNLYYLGWDEHLYRLFSSFLDPNFAGAFLVLYLLLVLGIFVNRKRLAYGFLSALALLGIVLTFSRSAYLMLFIGLITFLLLRGQRKLILGFIIVFTALISILTSTGLKSEGTNLLRITSTQARLPSAQNALFIFKRNPIFGIGFNAYEFASKRYGLSKTSKFPNHAAAGTDNSFLFILATTGVVGFLSYLYLWFKILLVPKKNLYSIVLISSSLALFIDSLFINSLFYTFIMLWMWILIGLAED